MANTKVIVIPEGKICDYVDGKFRNDTPEEYVRQTIEKRLVNEHKYLPKQIRIEHTLQLGSRKPRADIVIFDKDCTEQTQENIKIIIECKKEAVEARNAKDGVEQLKSYMSTCPNCEWGMWTNGRQKEVYRKYVNEKGQIESATINWTGFLRAYTMNPYEERNFNYVREKTTQTAAYLYVRIQTATC